MEFPSSEEPGFVVGRQRAVRSRRSCEERGKAARARMRLHRGTPTCCICGCDVSDDHDWRPTEEEGRATAPGSVYAATGRMNSFNTHTLGRNRRDTKKNISDHSPADGARRVARVPLGRFARARAAARAPCRSRRRRRWRAQGPSERCACPVAKET